MIKNIITSFVLSILTDFIWIGLIAKNFYFVQMGDLGRRQGGKLDIIYWSAFAVYILVSLAITFFVLPLADGRLSAAVGYGALLGLCLYGVYDLTNHATLRSWPLILMAGDILWGTFLCAVVSGLTLWIQQRFFA